MKNKKLDAIAETLQGKATRNISQGFFPLRDYVGACKLYLMAADLYDASGKVRKALRCIEQALRCQEHVNTNLI